VLREIGGNTPISLALAPRRDLAVSPSPLQKFAYREAIPPDVYLGGPPRVTPWSVSVRTPHLTVAGRYPERFPQMYIWGKVSGPSSPHHSLFNKPTSQ